MAGRQTKWRLAAGGWEDLDLEGDDRAVVREAGAGIKNEGKKRRRGLRAWLEYRRGEEDHALGRRTVEGLRIVGFALALVAFVVAAGLARGLMQEFEGGRRMFNIWLFLGVTVGLQWVVLIGGAASYFFVRRQSGALSVGQRLAGMLVRRMGGRVDGELWRSLVAHGRGYHSVLGWRLARMTQGITVMYNVGLIAGFFGCLWVLKVNLFWESTLFKIPTIEKFAQWIAAPWSWSGWGVLPPVDEQSYDILLKLFYIDGADGWPFLFLVIAVWGLLPRLLLWVACWMKGGAALAGLKFQEPRHRELWRGLSGVQRDLATEGPADGVVLVDVGGSGVETAALREFLLREMRVNPEGRYEAAVLDGGQEVEAWSAVRKAPLGVVFLVEGWALSPKQMDALYQRVRKVDGERMIRFLVLGAVHEGRAGAPEKDDFDQWKGYVDGLRDPWAEVVAFFEPEAVAE